MEKGNRQDTAAVLKANPDYLFRDIAGESILVPVGKTALEFNGLAALNGTATFIWKQILEGDKCLRDIVLAFMEEYELDKEQAFADVMDFVQALISHGIITSN